MYDQWFTAEHRTSKLNQTVREMRTLEFGHRHRLSARLRLQSLPREFTANALVYSTEVIRRLVWRAIFIDSPTGSTSGSQI